jgi:hypothetical protein
MSALPAKGGTVDRVALIVTALATAADPVLQGEKPDTVKVAHARLQDAVRRRWRVIQALNWR